MTSKHRNSRKAAASKKLFTRSLKQSQKRQDQTAQLNTWLVDLTKKTETELEYWKVFQNYLVDEREIRKERIQDALRSQSLSGFESNGFVRIVDTRYQNRPLSSYGSIAVPPGGRFNFGEISSYHQRFQALYLASDFRTAAAERFLRDQTAEKSIDRISLELRLDPNASFSSYRVKVSNLTIIDIRTQESLQAFTEVISEISVPKWMSELAIKLRQPAPRTVKKVQELHPLLLEPNFTQWGTFIDQPSVSQWFGYYVKESNIHGILYPSVRNGEGHNLCVFPENFVDTDAQIELIDDAAGVKFEDRMLNSASAVFQMQISHQILNTTLH